jgi:hypothetical protein
MTEDHADYVLAKLSVVFPNKTLTIEEVKFWIEKLGPYEFDDGMDAIGMIADNSKFWPSWSEFRECLKAIQRRHPVAALPEPSTDPVSKEEARAYMAEIRETIRTQAGSV